METLKQGTPDPAPDQVPAQTQDQTPVQNGVNNAADAPENDTNKSKGDIGDDEFYKILYSDPQIFIDLLPKVLPERILDTLDLSPGSVKPFPETSHTEQGNERRNDIVYQVRIKNSRQAVIILLEFQTKSDRNFAWRMVNYTYSVCERLASLNKYKGKKRPYVLSVVYYTGYNRWKAPLDVVETFEPLIEGFEPADLVSGRYFLLDVKHGEYTGGTENLCSMVIRAERAVRVPEGKAKFFEYINTFSDILKFVQSAEGAQFSELIRKTLASWAIVWLKETVWLTDYDILRLTMDQSYAERIREHFLSQKKQDEKRAVKRALAVADAEAEKEKQRALAEAGAEAEAEKQRALAEAAEKNQRALAEAAEKNQRALAEAEKNKQRAVAEVKKEKDLAMVGLLKNVIFTRYQDRFSHDVPEEVQKTVDNAQPKDIKALQAIFNYLSGHNGDEKEFMRFAKTSLA